MVLISEIIQKHSKISKIFQHQIQKQQLTWVTGIVTLPNKYFCFTYTSVEIKTNHVHFFQKITRKNQIKQRLKRLPSSWVMGTATLSPDLSDFRPSTLGCSWIYPFKRKSRLEKNKN